jgi:hypothetical protein
MTRYAALFPRRPAEPIARFVLGFALASAAMTANAQAPGGPNASGEPPAESARPRLAIGSSPGASQAVQHGWSTEAGEVGGVLAAGDFADIPAEAEERVAVVGEPWPLRLVLAIGIP